MTRMVSTVLPIILLTLVALSLAACAGRGDIEAERVAAQEAHEAQDDATCRSAEAEPGSAPYQACRQKLATERAVRAEIEYQKARDFDRVLGGLDDR